MWRRLARLVTTLAAAWVAAGLCVREVADLRVDDRNLGSVSTRGDTVLTRDNASVVFASRLAGAVWRLEYRGRVLVPELDGNGGSLQTALAFDREAPVASVRVCGQEVKLLACPAGQCARNPQRVLWPGRRRCVH